MNGKRSLWTRVSAGRWLAGFVTAMVLVALVGAAGALLKGIGTAEAPPTIAATPGGGSLSIRVTIPGVTGEGADKDKWIEAESFSFGLSQSGSFGSGPCGAGSPARCQASEFIIVKPLDKSSAVLFDRCCTGDVLPEVVIQFCKASICDKQKYQQFTMQSVVITGVQWSGGHGDSIPTEQISFVFEHIELQYFDQGPGGRNVPGAKISYDCSSWPECTRA